MKKNFQICLVACSLLLLSPLSLTAQSDSSANGKDRRSPEKATWLAVALPGAGQIYNHSYWKVPVLYAGFGALAYSIDFNHGEYKRFGNYYKLAADDDPDTNPDFPGTLEQFQQKRNYYKKYRDLGIIGVVALYGLQILDANVDAHLSYFDISDDLSLEWSPVLVHSMYSGTRSGGLRLCLHF